MNRCDDCCMDGKCFGQSDQVDQVDQVWPSLTKFDQVDQVDQVGWTKWCLWKSMLFACFLGSAKSVLFNKQHVKFHQTREFIRFQGSWGILLWCFTILLRGSFCLQKCLKRYLFEVFTRQGSQVRTLYRPPKFLLLLCQVSHCRQLGEMSVKSQ